MASIDLDKVGAALLHLQNDGAGEAALKQLRANLDAFTSTLPQKLNHSEQVFLLRTLMADLSIDNPQRAQTVPNIGAIAGAGLKVQNLGVPVIKNVAGFHVVSEK